MRAHQSPAFLAPLTTRHAPRECGTDGSTHVADGHSSVHCQSTKTKTAQELELRAGRLHALSPSSCRSFAGENRGTSGIYNENSKQQG